MALTQDQKNRIGEVVKDILLTRIEKFPALGAGIRNAPFHKLFLDCFEEELRPLHIEIPYLVAIASWMHGLNTSLGTGFENIGHILSGGYKRKFSGPYTLNIKTKHAAEIERIIRDLKGRRFAPDLKREDNLILNSISPDTEIAGLEFTADIYLETEKEIVAIEMKSVRPNSGEGRGEKQKILYGKAALKLLHPNKNIRFLVGFPFDPTSPTPTDYNKERFFNYLIEFKKFFDPKETLVASELWNFLSGGKNTMEEILEVTAKTVEQIKK